MITWKIFNLCQRKISYKGASVKTAQLLPKHLCSIINTVTIYSSTLTLVFIAWKKHMPTFVQSLFLKESTLLIWLITNQSLNRQVQHLFGLLLRQMTHTGEIIWNLWKNRVTDICLLNSQIFSNWWKEQVICHTLILHRAV